MEYNPGGPPPQGYGPVLFTITTTATERKKRQRSNKVLYVFRFQEDLARYLLFLKALFCIRYR